MNNKKTKSTFLKSSKFNKILLTNTLENIIPFLKAVYKINKLKLFFLSNTLSINYNKKYLGFHSQINSVVFDVIDSIKFVIQIKRLDLFKKKRYDTNIYLS